MPSVPPPKKRWYRPTAPPAVTTDRLQQFLPGWSDLITLMIILIILIIIEAIYANVKIINVFARKSPSSLEMLSPNCLPCGDHLSSSSATKVPQCFPEHDNSESVPPLLILSNFSFLPVFEALPNMLSNNIVLFSFLYFASQTCQQSQRAASVSQELPQLPF